MLTKIEKAGLILLLIVALAFGGLVVKRAAFMQRRMTDVDCYLRAAWAVRTGQDLYEILDPNDWHYNYPPLFAILMTPLADPPPEADRAGMLPFPVSVAIWYAVSLGCLGLGVHWLAGAIERTSPNPQVREQRAFCRRWWALRIVPILACLLPIGHTLMRGQVNLLLLALLCGMAAATLRGRSLLAGGCLAGAICLKVFPAFLLLFPPTALFQLLATPKRGPDVVLPVETRIYVKLMSPIYVETRPSVAALARVAKIDDFKEKIER